MRARHFSVVVYYVIHFIIYDFLLKSTNKKMRGKNSRRMRQRFSRKRKGQKSFLWANKHFSQPPFPPRIKIVTSKEEVAVLPADFLSEGYRRNFFNQIFHKNAIFWNFATLWIFYNFFAQFFLYARLDSHFMCHFYDFMLNFSSFYPRYINLSFRKLMQKRN